MVAEGGRKPDWLGRAIGLVVFFGGIALLVVVFQSVNGLKAPPPEALRKPDAVALELGLEVLKRVACGLIASWIAANGARLYAAANRAVSGD